MEQDTEWALRILMSAGSESTERVSDIAWAAGLFEGEGCASRSCRKGRVYLNLVIDSTDRDVLARFHRVIQGGSFTGPRQKDGRKPIWRWVAVGKEALRIVGDEDFVGQLGQRRRARIAEIVTEIANQPPPQESRWRTHCRKCGTLWDEANTVNQKNGFRQCRACRRVHMLKVCERRKAETLARRAQVHAPA